MPVYAGYFNGDVVINGVGSTNPGGVFTSDQQFKTNVDTIQNIKSIVSQLKPRSFYFDTTNVYGMNFSSKKQYGFIAQDVQTILPELVSTLHKPQSVDSTGAVVTPSVTYKGLNYDAFFALLTKAVQQQQKTIDSLVIALGSSARMANPTNNDSIQNPTEQISNINKQQITLSNADMLVLDQNQPNPFNEKTTITYNVPEKYGYAQMIFTTNEGKIMKIVDITKKGHGEITVYANDLSAGIYQYTLVVDGKNIETKKMIKQ